MPTSSGDVPKPVAGLAVEALSAGYGRSPVITDVTISVKPGTVVAVLGPNGAGKSTLLKAITGEIPALAGKVSLDGVDITRLSADRRARSGMGYVPQSRDVFDPLTVIDNLRMGGYFLGRRELESRIREVQSIFPALKAMDSRLAGKLSGGERKMLAIARTLMLAPHLLIVDEPSANLAPDLAKRVLTEQVRKLADAGVGVLLVEQRAFEALQVADWGHVLVAGRSRMEGSPQDLLGRADLRDVFLGGGASSMHTP